VLLARPRSEECSARQGPRTRARQRARGRQQDRSRQAQGDGRVRQIRIQHRRGPGGPAASWCPRGVERQQRSGARRGAERTGWTSYHYGDDRATDPAASSLRSGLECAGRALVAGTHAGPRRPAQAAGSRPSGPAARSGREAGQRPRHRGGGRRGACLGAEGRAGSRRPGRSGCPYPGRRAPGAAASGRQHVPSAAPRPRHGSAASGLPGRRSSRCPGRAQRRPSRPGRWRPSAGPWSR